MPSQPHSYHNLFESLEDRVLFDGVPDATFILPQAEGQEPIPAQVQNVQQADISGPRELILIDAGVENACLLYTSPSPRDRQKSRMPSSA